MILVLNFGGQYAHLIARRVRDLGVYSEVRPCDIPLREIGKLKPEGIILSGGPSSVYEHNAPAMDRKVLNLGIPVLGICYGHQLMAYQLRGKVSSHEKKQFGKETLTTQKSLLFSGLTSPQTVWFSHGDQVDKLPPGFRVIGKTKNAKIAAYENSKKKFFAIQFHPEVTHTANGMHILKNFLFKIANVKKDWNINMIKNVCEFIF